MVTINSLSGGKTSSYLATHYPADYEIFALVCNEDVDCAPKDKSLVKRVNEKLEKYIPAYGEFIGTPEDPKIPKVMLDLEQHIGREIVWVRSESFDEVIRNRKALPNQFKRFCTSELKIKPIFWYAYLYLGLPVNMRMGFRYDEKERANRLNNTFKFEFKSEYQSKSQRWINRWEEIEWKENSFPLIDNKIVHPTIQKYWKRNNIDFPSDSNCQHCFWKPEQQLRKNFDNNYPQMKWAKERERERQDF